MKKNTFFLVALASSLLATACSTDDMPSGTDLSKSKIDVHPIIGNVNTRANETTTANLQEFKTYSFLTEDDSNFMDGILYSNNAGAWTTDAGTFYWPETGDLNFYSYAPENPGSEGNFAISATSQKLTGFVPYSTAATQQDFIYSKATGNLADNGASGVDLNFSHALSEITVAAKNDNTAYTVEVTGVKVGNVISKGDFTFPSLAGDDAAWTLGTDKATYTTTWDNANTLSSVVSDLDAANTAFMLIPQQLEVKDKAIEGNYIALKIKLTMQGGHTIYNGWSYIAVPTLWEMNKHYHYTVDYTSGAGQDENGNPIINGSSIRFNVTVTPWDQENNKIPSFISGIGTEDNGYVYINRKGYNITHGEWIVDCSNIYVTDLSRMFIENTGVFDIDMTNMNTCNVTNMQSMFEGCWELSSINLTGVDTHNVVDMKYMFDHCRSLTSLDVSSFDTRKVTEMTYMFDGCKKLENIDMSGWNLENITDMEGMFEDCNALKTIYMVGCDVTTINKVKAALTEAGLSTDIVKTTRE